VLDAGRAGFDHGRGVAREDVHHGSRGDVGQQGAPFLLVAQLPVVRRDVLVRQILPRVAVGRRLLAAGQDLHLPSGVCEPGHEEPADMAVAADHQDGFAGCHYALSLPWGTNLDARAGLGSGAL